MQHRLLQSSGHIFINRSLQYYTMQSSVEDFLICTVGPMTLNPQNSETLRCGVSFPFYYFFKLWGAFFPFLFYVYECFTWMPVCIPQMYLIFNHRGQKRVLGPLKL